MNDLSRKLLRSSPLSQSKRGVSSTKNILNSNRIDNPQLLSNRMNNLSRTSKEHNPS